MHATDIARPIEKLDIVWGAPLIAEMIGRNARETYHLLEKGHLPGAKKIGGRWCISRRKLAALFDASEGDDA